MAHECDLPRIRHGMHMFNHAVDILGLAVGDVDDEATTAAVRANIAAKTNFHEVYTNFQRDALLSFDILVATGCFTNALINSADTIAGVRSLFDDATGDPSITNTSEQRTFAIT